MRPTVIPAMTSASRSLRPYGRVKISSSLGRKRERVFIQCAASAVVEVLLLIVMRGSRRNLCTRTGTIRNSFLDSSLLDLESPHRIAFQEILRVAGAKRPKSIRIRHRNRILAGPQERVEINCDGSPNQNERNGLPAREGFLENDHPNEQLQGGRQVLQESHGGKPQKLGRAIEP